METLLHFIFRTSGVMSELSLNLVSDRPVIFYEVKPQIYSIIFILFNIIYSTCELIRKMS